MSLLEPRRARRIMDRTVRRSRMDQVSVATGLHQNCNNMGHARSMQFRHETLTLSTEVPGNTRVAICSPRCCHASQMHPCYLLSLGTGVRVPVGVSRKG